MERGWPVPFTDVSLTDVSLTDVLITDVLFTGVLITDVLITNVSITDVLFTDVLFTDVSFTDVSFTEVVDHWAFWVAPSSAGSSSIHSLFEWVDLLVVFTWRCWRREVRSGEQSGGWRLAIHVWRAG